MNSRRHFFTKCFRSYRLSTINMSYPTSLCTSHASSKYRCRSLSTQSDEAGMNAFMEFEREMAKKRLQANIPSSQLDLNMPLEPPIKPKDDECCHLDCPNCVLLVYQEKLLEYEMALKAKEKNEQQQKQGQGKDQDKQSVIAPSPPPPKYEVKLYASKDELSPSAQKKLEKNQLAVYTVASNDVISEEHVVNDSIRSVRHIELFLEAQQQEILGEETSNIAVFVPNQRQLVNRHLELLQATEKAEDIYQATQLEANASPNTKLFLDVATIRDCLTYCIDLTSTPRSNFLRAIAAYTTNEKHIEILTSINALERIKADKKSEEVTLVDILELFPSVVLDFQTFLQFAPLNPPRYYTVSSSRRLCPTRVSMTLGLRRPVTTKNPVYARCSSYLSSLKPQVDQIHANFLKSSFIFPRHDRKPIVMIATGTGIAPFRAFLQELIFEKKRLEKNITSTFDSLSIGINTISTGSQKRRNAYLFYGCRDASQDFLYHQEILDAASREIDPEPLLDELVVQFSKMVSSKNLWIDDTDEATNQYVQHALQARKSFLYDHLIKEKGYIYICGSLSMGREVKKVLEEVLRNEKNNINLQELIDKKQIITELW